MRRAAGRALPLVLPLAAILWLQLTAELRNGDASAASLLIALATVTFVMARGLSLVNNVAVPGLVVLAAAAFAVLRRDVLLGGPLDAPLGYSNAAGALYMLAAAAALLLVLRVRGPAARVVFGIAAIAFAAIPVLNEARTAVVVVCLMPLALLVGDARALRAVIVASGVILVAANLLVVAVASTYVLGRPMSRAQHVVASALSGRRLLLWREALEMLDREPLFGVGPGRFPLESATARADRDTQWPHSEPLHFAAESGLPGLLLGSALIAWAFAWLWREPADFTCAALGTAVLMGACLQASVDYVLHFPAVIVAAAALVGAARGMTAATARTTALPRAPLVYHRPVLLQ